jgi:hypothetical protein
MKIQVFWDVMLCQCHETLILRRSVTCHKTRFFSDTAVRTSDLTLTKNALRNAYYKFDSQIGRGRLSRKSEINF